MTKRRTNLRTLHAAAAIGFAADRRGSGVAYARVTAGGEHLLRVPFHTGRTLPERETGYAALTAVARTLRERGFGCIRFAVDDAALVEDLAGHAILPDAIVLPYVRLRCALNQLDDFSVHLAAESDLAARARAEIALNVAA
ncbi:MAG: hypothetical protein WB615_14680 [Candidatus Tumulicola sp.]